MRFANTLTCADFEGGGLPDVFVWSRNSDQWYGIEYKGPSGSNPKKQDKVQASQDAWYRAGQELGLISDSNYVVAKWEPTSEQVRLLQLQKEWRL